jgi:hypothetical protein
MWRAILISLGVGVVCLAFGGCNLNVSERWEEQAAKLPRLTCEEILRRGPGTDDLVIVSDVRPCSRQPVYWSTGGGDISVDEYFYLPVYPAGAAKEPENRDVTFLYYSSSRDAGRALIGQRAGTEVLCTVRLAAGQLDTSTEELLESQYPGLRARQCWLLTTHRTGTMTEWAEDAHRSGIGFLVAGVGLIAGAIFLGAMTLLRRVSKSPDALEESPEPQPETSEK